MGGRSLVISVARPTWTECNPHIRLSVPFGMAITPSDSGYSGDGMAFVISLAPLSDAWPGEYLGLSTPYEYTESANRFFAIELDTVANKELRDIDDNHVGIDLNNVTSAGSSTAAYSGSGIFNPLRLSNGNLMQVWVDYYSFGLVEVRLAPVPMDKPFAAFLTYGSVDLAKVLNNGTKSKAGVPTMAYAGFSAASGDAMGTHQVLGWSFSMSESAKPLNLPLVLQQSDSSRVQEAHDKKKLVTWLPVVVSLVAILAGIAAWLLLRRWCRIRNSEWNQDWEAELGPRRFAFNDLRRATNGFHDNQILGKGGFGRVYGGAPVGSGVRVAVKRISSESRQGLAQFTAEIIILGRLRHRNLVRLIGYCRHKDEPLVEKSIIELLLIYERMPNGSLDSYLHAHTTLSWTQRLCIIKGVAFGLLYLHEDWEQVIMHRDVKASWLHDHGTDAHTTHVAGTRGYLAPELMRFGKATEATDVFAFGAFVFEVACGSRPMGLNARGELLVLVQWVRDMWEGCSGQIIDAVDPRLDDFMADEAELVLKLGLLCSHPLPAARPGMRLVMRYLNGDLPLPEFEPGYLAVTDVDQVLEAPPSAANSITGLSGGR
ncbi:hypothetical protein VPH35_080901 [Triticum aestivum]